MFQGNLESRCSLWRKAADSRNTREALPTDLLGQCAAAFFSSLLAEALQMSHASRKCHRPTREKWGCDGHSTSLGSDICSLDQHELLVQTWQVLETGGCGACVLHLCCVTFRGSLVPLGDSSLEMLTVKG